MRDDEDGKPTPDSDRAAILARRKQFIALALSGLATTACTSGDTDEGKAGPDKTETKSKPENQVPPQPCLSIEEPPEELDPKIPPQVCLNIAAPETGETGEALAEPPELAPPEPPKKPEPKPRPCLKKAPPPQACLNF